MSKYYNDGFDDELLQRPLAQKIIRAHSDLVSSLCFAKDHRPEEREIQQRSRETLVHLQRTCPMVYNAVMRRLGWDRIARLRGIK